MDEKLPIVSEIESQVVESIKVAKTTKEEQIQTELTPEQEQKLLDWWNNSPKDSQLLLRDAVVAVFGPGFDGRSWQAKLVKKSLASRQIKAQSTFTGRREINLELSSEQKEFITNNIDKMTPFEIAKTLFPEVKMSALRKEFILVNQFVGTLQNVIKYQPPNQVREGNYRPPKNLTEAANKVNQYIRNGIDIELAKKDKKLQECLNGLVKFCHNHHFILNIDNMVSDIDKNLFEGRFIAYTWNKPDLTEEEVDAYILLCGNIVTRAQLQRQKDNLNQMLENQMEEKDGKVYMSMVEMINNINKSADECEKRQDKLRKDLTGLRTDRIDLKIKENQSAAQFVELWRDEEKRNLLLNLADKQKLIIKDELNRQETFDDTISQFWGIDKKAFE
jgi:hypothetical protein